MLTSLVAVEPRASQRSLGSNYADIMFRGITECYSFTKIFGHIFLHWGFLSLPGSRRDIENGNWAKKIRWNLDHREFCLQYRVILMRWMKEWLHKFRNNCEIISIYSRVETAGNVLAVVQIVPGTRESLNKVNIHSIQYWGRWRALRPQKANRSRIRILLTSNCHAWHLAKCRKCTLIMITTL